VLSVNDATKHSIKEAMEITAIQNHKKQKKKKRGHTARTSKDSENTPKFHFNRRGTRYKPYWFKILNNKY
jgi:hypothetical protein